MFSCPARGVYEWREQQPMAIDGGNVQLLSAGGCLELLGDDIGQVARSPGYNAQERFTTAAGCDRVVINTAGECDARPPLDMCVERFERISRLDTRVSAYLSRESRRVSTPSAAATAAALKCSLLKRVVIGT